MPKMKLSKDGFNISIQPIEGNRLESLSLMELSQQSLYINSAADDEIPTYIIGDLHGNALKLLSVLYLCGAVKYDAEAHKKWSALYYNCIPNLPKEIIAPIKRSQFTPAQVKSWKDGIKKLDKEMSKSKRPSSFDGDIKKILSALRWNNTFLGHVILCGDQVHDRGRSDYMTLSLMKEMTAHAIPWTYVCGNHDQALVRACTGGTWMADQATPGEVNSNDWMASGLSACSWDYGLLDTKHQENMKNMARSAMKHMKLIETITYGENTLVCTHAPLAPELLPHVYNQLASMLGRPLINVESPMTRELINGINTLFISAAFGSDAEGQALCNNFSGTFQYPGPARSKAGKSWQLSVSDPSPLAAFLQNRALFDDEMKTGYPGWKNVFGHTGEGSLANAGKTVISDISICLDTELGKRRERNAPSSIAKFARYPEDVETVEDNLERDKGPLLMCSIKPDLADKAQKFRQMRAIIFDATGAYMEWQTKASSIEHLSDESDTAATMQSAASRAKTTYELRDILRKWAKNEYPFTPAGNETTPIEHRFNLGAFSIEALNAHYPPISLAARIGSAQIIPKSFHVDYKRSRHEPMGSEEIATIKRAAIQRLAQASKSEPPVPPRSRSGAFSQ